LKGDSLEAVARQDKSYLSFTVKAQGCNSFLLFALAHSNRQLSLTGIEALLFPIIAFHYI
jgi:hypothetical protein